MDVTTEYEKNKKQGIGSIVYEPNTRISDRKIGDWYFNKYGGEIIILEEKYEINAKNPDAIINGMFAEFKTSKSITSIEYRLRTANKQILAAQERTGTIGHRCIIILDISQIDETENTIINASAKYLVKRIKGSADLMIRKGNETLIIIRK